jgi:ADP-ribose pyrophosphatase
MLEQIKYYQVPSKKIVILLHKNKNNMNNQEYKNPWTTLKSEHIYDSPWIGLTKHDILNPNGNPGTYSVVHFKNLAIGILPLDKDYYTWIVGQYRYPINQYSWEIPEGGGQRDVPPLISAQRELLEETGITANKWTKIQEMYLSNSASDEFCTLYIAQNLSFGEAEPEDNEQLEMRKLHFDELYKMVESGEITDSLTVCIVLKTKLMMLEGKI